MISVKDISMIRKLIGYFFIHLSIFPHDSFSSIATLFFIMYTLNFENFTGKMGSLTTLIAYFRIGSVMAIINIKGEISAVELDYISWKEY